MNGKATTHISIAHERETQNHCKHNACSLTSHCVKETQKCQVRKCLHSLLQQYEIYEQLSTKLFSCALLQIRLLVSLVLTLLNEVPEQDYCCY